MILMAHAFEVLNPTSDTYEFHWMPEETEKKETEDPFRCLTKPVPKKTIALTALSETLFLKRRAPHSILSRSRRGTILPGKKFEMLFEYLPAASLPAHGHGLGHLFATFLALRHLRSGYRSPRVPVAFLRARQTGIPGLRAGGDCEGASNGCLGKINGFKQWGCF